METKLPQVIDLQAERAEKRASDYEQFMSDYFGKPTMEMLRWEAERGAQPEIF